MAVAKTIDIDGKPTKFRASAAVPRLYRCKFGRDIYKDLQKLEKGLDDEDADIESLEVFENVAYILAKHADPSVPDSPDEWLDGYGMFSIYEVLPQIIDLWGLNTAQEAESKKKQH